MSLTKITSIAIIGVLGSIIYMYLNDPTLPTPTSDSISSGLDNLITICVIGGGLAGLSAALTAHDEATKFGLPGSGTGAGLRILIFEKESQPGGNSAKASSGINALNLLRGDSVELFTRDTLKSGGGLSDESLVETLVRQSPEAVSFLESRGLDLSSVTQLGGHSVPRSFSPPSGPNVGLAIMQALIKQAQELPDLIIRGGTKVTEVHSIILENGRVVGIRVSKAGEEGKDEAIACDAAVLATGGFAANKTLLETHSPIAALLATTNGPWAQGDGLAIAQAAGAELIHMTHVQIHPTGFVNPKDPKAGTKWLAPEKLRGAGALLINSEGKRFVNELATRDTVSEAMLQLPGKQATLLLGPASSEAFGIQTLDFYVSRGIMTLADSLRDLASRANLPLEPLEATIAAYNTAAEAGFDELDKTIFPCKVSPEGPFYAAQVVPVVHYTMGGVKIDEHARVLDTAGKPIPGLYAAGEVSGGVHGRNRLGGNSLLECLVFGSIAGKGAVLSSVSSSKL